MDIKTHQMIDRNLCGNPTAVSDGFARVELQLTGEMAADSSGLIHGGFIFGAADYAAMLAVNHPNVVLGGSDVRFLKPVRTGDTITAEARITRSEGKKREVAAEVFRSGEKVFTGQFTCFIPDRHVLGKE